MLTDSQLVLRLVLISLCNSGVFLFFQTAHRIFVGSCGNWNKKCPDTLSYLQTETVIYLGKYYEQNDMDCNLHQRSNGHARAVSTNMDEPNNAVGFGSFSYIKEEVAAILNKFLRRRTFEITNATI